VTDKAATNILKIPTTLCPVKMWVHPEGQVIGSLFLHDEHGNEVADDILTLANQPEPFLVFKCEMPEELRFYNRNSIIRMEYVDKDTTIDNVQSLECQLHMMDGSLISGTIRETLPPDYSRLYDYLNLTENRFVKIYTTNDEIILINKTYINQVTIPQSK